jgi:hypothetical protein
MKRMQTDKNMKFIFISAFTANLYNQTPNLKFQWAFLNAYSKLKFVNSSRISMIRLQSFELITQNK